ncbi:hypothetical protein C5167_027907 [Papaver somniferum]|uniref:protein kinase PINOID 2-like n=1 Tax=Papaver somniferum TaxID=3469 RepID=UPI000E6F686F|nr:protein kinase PINOID 2-like [Papaver somniferum]RZC92021.1 hypothetical protein C5167_027907 [Papaver somniferum]
MAIKHKDESDHETSSCSSITVPESGHSWIGSNMSFGSRNSVSVSSTSFGDYNNIHKPHKANQVAWEAMKKLRGLQQNGQLGLDHFRLVRRVGSGDIGNVYVCQLRNNPAADCLYAMKVVDKEALAFRNKLQRAEMEKEILCMLDHPFLPTLYANFEVSHYSCLVMEFCPGGDLHSVRQRQPGKRFSVASAKFYAAETLLALEYLHMMGIVYRDLKPENVLVRDEGHIMLSDFDLSLKCEVVPKLVQSSKPSVEAIANCVTTCGSTPMQPVLSCFSASSNKKKVATTNDYKEDNEDDNGNTGDAQACGNGEFDKEFVAEPINARSKSFVGTHEYLAPEVISGLGHGSAVDWWTFGVFLYEMLYGKTPFKGETNEKTLVNILKKPLTFPGINVSSSKDLEEMIKVQDLISKLLVKNPKKRIGSLKGALEIKRHEFFKGVNWALIRSVKPPEVPRDQQKIKMAMMNKKKIIATATSLPKKLSKKEREDTYQIPNHQQHFDYF